MCVLNHVKFIRIFIQLKLINLKVMKKLFTLLLIALFVQTGFAQEEKIKEEKVKEDGDMKTLFTKDNLKFTGGYLAPEIKISNVYEDMSMFIGGKVGFTFNDKFSIGMAGYGLVNNSDFVLKGYPDADDEILATIGMGYGGLLLEYTIFTNKVMHFTIPVVVGAGGISLYEDNGDWLNNEWNEIENSAAFVVEPGVTVELNLFKFFRVDLGASYRYVSGTSLDFLDDEDLTDLSFNATFKFGFF